MRNLIPICILIICFSCNVNDKTSSKQELEYTIHTDTFQLNQGKLHSFFRLVDINGSTYLFIKYDGVDSLYFYSIHPYRTQLSKVIKTKNPRLFDFDSEFGGIRNCYFINEDSAIFFKKSEYESEHLFLYSFKADSVLFSRMFFMEKIYTQEDTTTQYYTKNTSRFVWNPINKSIYLPITFIKKDESNQGLFLVEIFTETGEEKVLPYKLPQIYNSITQQCRYPFNDNIIGVISQNKKLNYCFGITNEILQIDLASGDHRYISVPHTNFSEPIPYCFEGRISPDDFGRNMDLTFCYNQFFYDQKRDVFYRFYKMEMPDINEDGLKTTWKDFQFGFTVLSSDFEEIGEILLDSTVYNYHVSGMRFSNNSIYWLTFSNDTKEFIMRRVEIKF